MDGLTKKLVLALSVSVALNLFLLGFGAARMLGRRGASRGPRDMPAALHAHWRPHQERLRPVRKRVRDARGAVHAQLTSEPFDRAALSASLAALREATGRGQEAFHAALVDMAAQLDAEGRRALAANRRLWRGGGGGGRGPREHGPHEHPPPGEPDGAAPPRH